MMSVVPTKPCHVYIPASMSDERIATSNMITGIAASGPMTAAARCQVFGIYMAYMKIRIIQGIDGLSVGRTSAPILPRGVPSADSRPMASDDGRFSNGNGSE